MFKPMKLKVNPLWADTKLTNNWTLGVISQGGQ